MENKSGVNRFYTTRLSNCVNRQQPAMSYYIITPKNSYPTAVMYSEKIPKEVFVYGKGWVKVKPSQVQTLTLNRVTTYYQLFELVKKYGYRCAAELVGFHFNSIGDRYPIAELAHMEMKHGERFVNYLERIAEIDYKILQYFTTVLGLSVKNSSYDMWITCKAKGCLFRVNPFLGFKLSASFYGIPISPSIDVISFDAALWSVISQFHPEFQCDMSVESYDAVKHKYDSISLKGWIDIMCGADDADWLSKNLTLWEI